MVRSLSLGVLGGTAAAVVLAAVFSSANLSCADRQGVARPDQLEPQGTPAALPSKEGIITDTTTGARFVITIRSAESELLEQYDPAAFRVECSTVAAAGEEPTGSSDFGLDEVEARPLGGEPTLFIDIKPVEPATGKRFASISLLPPTATEEKNAGCAAICFVYTYALLEVKSVVVRANPCGGGTAYFLHRHCSGCATHGLYSTSFSYCTYAYDCFPGHSMDVTTVCGSVPPGGAWPVTMYLWSCGGRC